MIVIFTIILLMLTILIIKRKIILQKLKLFLKEYKILIIGEIILIIIILIINMFNKTIVIKEKNPHSNEVLKSTIVKEGETYNYFSQISSFIKKEKINTNNIWNSGKKFLETDNISESIIVKKVRIFTVIIEKSGQEKEYSYGEGFSYYTANSCMCGTPIRFYKTTYEIFKIIVLSTLIMDFIIICLVKENKLKGEKVKCQK